MASKVDFVVTWVDNQDQAWLKEKNYYSASNKKVLSDGNGEERYRDTGFFKYWFRSVEKYAPWVNKIYFITYGHIPKWLDINHPKLKIINHRDYIPEKYLPTFNSNVIELNLHRIDELSETFVVFNDDVFLNSMVSEEEFFQKNLPLDYGIYSPIVPDGIIAHTFVNNVIVANKYFREKKSMRKNWTKFFSPRYKKKNLNNLVSLLYPGIEGYHSAHITVSALKSTFIEVWDKEFEVLDSVCNSKFRTEKDISHWLMSHWNIETGKFYPQRAEFGLSFEMGEIEQIANAMNNTKVKVLCINDSEHTDDFEEYSVRIRELFSKKFPEKSQFEV